MYLYFYIHIHKQFSTSNYKWCMTKLNSSWWVQWRTEGGGLGVQTPYEIPKALQNRAKLNPIVKIVKHCWI